MGRVTVQKRTLRLLRQGKPSSDGCTGWVVKSIYRTCARYQALSWVLGTRWQMKQTKIPAMEEMKLLGGNRHER